MRKFSDAMTGLFCLSVEALFSCYYKKKNYNTLTGSFYIDNRPTNALF
jgi:hypothetical protein